MKRLFLVVLLGVIFLAGMAYGAPFLSCDPAPLTSTQPTQYEIFVDGATVPVISPAKLTDNGAVLYWDLAGLAPGTHSIVYMAVTIDPKWGRLASSSTNPFVLIRPSNPLTPTGIGLVPQ